MTVTAILISGRTASHGLSEDMTALDIDDMIRTCRDDEIDATEQMPEPPVVLDHDGTPHTPIEAVSGGETHIICGRCDLILDPADSATGQQAA